jgi:hypothetical protein
MTNLTAAQKQTIQQIAEQMSNGFIFGGKTFVGSTGMNGASLKSLMKLGLV